MNRIDAKFKELKEKGVPAFIPFITAGDPSLDATKELIFQIQGQPARMLLFLFFGC